MPVSSGTLSKKRSSASSPPAEAPIPTTYEGGWSVIAAGLEQEPYHAKAACYLSVTASREHSGVGQVATRLQTRLAHGLEKGGKSCRQRPPLTPPLGRVGSSAT